MNIYISYCEYIHVKQEYAYILVNLKSASNIRSKFIFFPNGNKKLYIFL